MLCQQKKNGDSYMSLCEPIVFYVYYVNKREKKQNKQHVQEERVSEYERKGIGIYANHNDICEECQRDG